MIYGSQIFCSQTFLTLEIPISSFGPFKDLCYISIDIFIQYFWDTNTQNNVQRENGVCTVWKIIFVYDFLLAWPMWY